MLRVLSLIGLLCLACTAAADPYDYCRSPMWIGPAVIEPDDRATIHDERYWVIHDVLKGHQTFLYIGHIDCWRIHLTDDEIVRIRAGAMLVVRTELGDYDALGLR